MHLGELLVEAKIITQSQLSQALKSQARYPNHSLGRVVSKTCNVPMEIIETTIISKLIIPRIELWFKQNIDQKSQKDGIPLSSIIKDFELEITSYTRYEGEAITYIRNEMGYYCEDKRDARLERLAIIVDTLKLTTRRKQEIILHDIHLKIAIDTDEIKAENPGFLTEARLKLLHALKQSGNALK